MKTEENKQTDDAFDRGYAGLIKAASGFTNLTNPIDPPNPVLSDDFEHRVMLEITRRTIVRARRRARYALVSSLSGLAMLCGACIALFLSWAPALSLSALGAPFKAAAEWLGNLQFSVFGQQNLPLSFLDEWGGMLILTLLVGGATGFFYCINSIFNENL